MAEQTDVRELAVEVLLDVEKNHTKLNEVLGKQLLKYQYLNKSNRALLTRLCEGTIETQIQMDYVLNQISSVPVSKCKPFIRCLLRSGAYQILYMDAIPDHAVCNESVKLAKKKGFVRLSGFVNAVLRNISRKKENLSYPAWETDPVQAIAIRYSLPEWIVQQWITQYSAETAKIMAEAAMCPAATTLRVNTVRTSLEQLKEELVRENITVKELSQGMPGAYDSQLRKIAVEITGYDYLARYETYRKGCFVVQDLSSMIPGVELEQELLHKQQKDLIVMDVCAAPGGKTTHAAMLLKERGMVYASDISVQKVEKIRENCERLMLQNVKVSAQDAVSCRKEFLNQADVVLCDAPCSGLGVLGRKKDIAYHMSPEQQQELARLQRQILDTVCAYVKPGGALFYSTCTVNRAENQENVLQFLNKHPQFQLEKEQQFLPGVMPCDGFYFAKMRKEK